MNGVGLDRDVHILKQSLQSQGFTVSFTEHKGIKSLWRYFQRSRQYDANIFIERVFPCWIGLARKNFVIPNQERFPKRMLSTLRNIDGVLCKTQHCLDIFRPIVSVARFIGFSSVDKFQAVSGKNYSEFFHLAGRSSLKGTEDILALWEKHPEWPKLTLVQHPRKAPQSVPPNVRLYAERISEQDLNRLQNTIGIHLCVSRSEGWGHYLVEAMSTAAVVVTTDGAPMNQLIDSSRGVLVKVNRTEQRHLGTNFFIDIQSLEVEIERLIAAQDENQIKKGRRAREWFEDNQTRFGPRLAQVLMNLI